MKCNIFYFVEKLHNNKKTKWSIKHNNKKTNTLQILRQNATHQPVEAVAPVWSKSQFIF